MKMPSLNRFLMLVIGIAAFAALCVASDAVMARVAVVVVVGVPVSCFLIDRFHRFCLYGEQTRRPPR
jgi:hypothetical protein